MSKYTLIAVVLLLLAGCDGNSDSIVGKSTGQGTALSSATLHSQGKPEGAAGESTQMEFLFSMTRARSSQVMLVYETVDGTATAGEDY